MDGYGKLYYPNNNLAYEGNWKDDKFEDRGIVYNDGIELNQFAIDYSDFSNIEDLWIKYDG